MGGWISKGVSLDDWRETTKLSYDWYWWLALIPGSFEQLYLGSPKTFMIKNFMNVILLGYPWLYEVLMATTSIGRPQVELFGSPNPLTNSIHVGGGRFASKGDEPSDKHARAILYAVALVMLGFIGGDSFVMGNYTTGFFRLLCALTIFLAPISLIWWIYKLFLYIFATDSVYAQDGEWFGYPSAITGSCSPSALDQLTGWVFTVLNAVTSPFPFLNIPINIMKTTWETAKQVTVTLWGFVQKNVVGAAIGATSAATAAGNITAGDVDKKAADIAAAAEEAEASSKATASQKGGGSQGTLALDTSSALGALLTGTVGFIFVSSIVLSWRRTYQNAGASKATTAATATATATDADQRPGEGNDVPPEPRAPRAAPQGS